MEKDQAGQITRFDVGDEITYQGEEYTIGPASARNLNQMLEATKRGVSALALSFGTFSLRKSDGSGYTPLEVSHLDLFRQLPVDLSRVK